MDSTEITFIDAQNALEELLPRYKRAQAACKRSRSQKNKAELIACQALFDDAYAQLNEARDAHEAAEARAERDARRAARAAAKAQADWLQPRLI